MWFQRRATLYLAIVSVFVHMAVLFAVYRASGRIDRYAFESLDCTEYYRIATNVARHGTFSQSSDPPLKPDTWRTPGYPLFLAAIMLVAGDSPAALIISQQLLSVLNVLLLFRIARRFMSNRRAAVVAGCFLLEPYHLYYSLWLMATTLFVTLILLTGQAWYEAVARRGWLRWGWVGVLCGGLVLVRPVALLVPVALLGGMLFLALRESWGRGDTGRRPGGWLGLAAAVAGCIVVLMPWMIRNRLAAGHFALSDQGGVVLAYFKATEVVLWREGRTADRYLETSLDPARADEPHRVWEEIDTRLRRSLPGLTDEQQEVLGWPNLAQGNRTEIDSFEISQALTRIGLSYLLASPVSTVACYAVRCGTILTFPLNLAIQPAKGVSANRWRSAVLAAPYVLLCVAVVIALIRRRRVTIVEYFPVAATLALLLGSTPQIDPRFRVPMIPLLLFLALLPATAANPGPPNSLR